MATRRALEKQAEELNRAQRNLRQYTFYSAKGFWSKTSMNSNAKKPVGNTAISGGTIKKREAVLLGMVAQIMKSRIPTVMIANGSEMPDIDDRMIDLVSGNPDTQLIVTSAENNNYDFFAGWSVPQIVDFFCTCAIGDGLSSGEMMGFLQQYFLLIEKVYGEVNLRTLADAAHMAQGGRESIEVLIQKLGDDIDTNICVAVNYLRRTTEQRQNWEVMLHKVLDGLGALQTDYLGYSLKKHLPGSGEIILIHAEDASDHELLTKYLEKELASKRTLPFQLIICECADERMITWSKALINAGSVVTLCTQSIYTVLGEDGLKLPFQNMVFLFDRCSMPLNTGRELSMLGSFHYWQVAEGGSSPPVAFSYWTGTHAGLVSEERNKVMPQDVVECEAVFYGHSSFLSKNEIALVHKML